MAGNKDHFKLMQRAQMLMDVERWREALHELNLAIAQDPTNYSALCQAANCHLKLREFQQALDRTKSAIENEPEAEWAFRLRSQIFTENGEPTRALEAARLCAGKAPYSFQSIHCLFWAEASYGNYDDAEKTLARLRELGPGSSSSHEAAGYLALNKKKLKEAENHFLEALKINPESVSALNNLGVVYLNLARQGKGRHYQKKSVEMFERAVRTKPTFTKGQENIKSASSNLIKFGGGGFFLVWVIIRVISWSASSVRYATSNGPGVASSSDPSPFFAIGTSSYLLTAANIYFLIALAGLVVGIALLFTRHRFVIVYELFALRGWLYLIGVFGLALAMFLTAMWGYGLQGTAISGLGLAVSAIAVITATVHFLKFWSARRKS
jgi:tetratricopeptide (TPR) repeat protein